MSIRIIAQAVGSASKRAQQMRSSGFQTKRTDVLKSYSPIDNEAAEYMVDKRIPLLASDTPYTLDV